MRTLILALLLAAPAAAQERVPGVGAQDFTLDPSHASVVVGVDHVGSSRYTATFDRIEGRMHLDPDDPAAARLAVTIDAASLDLPAPPPGFLETLLGPGWLDAGAGPAITFVSDRVTLTGPDTADIAGTLTLAGTSGPAVIAARSNGGYDGRPWKPPARLGFSGTMTVRRSDFGVTAGLPPPGSTLGVGDLVEVAIETEWLGTPGAAPPS